MRVGERKQVESECANPRNLALEKEKERKKREEEIGREGEREDS
jgi:hypothetical protein